MKEYNRECSARISKYENWQLKDGKKSKIIIKWNAKRDKMWMSKNLHIFCDTLVSCLSRPFSAHSKQTFRTKTDLQHRVFFPFLFLLCITFCSALYRTKSERNILVINRGLDNYTNMVWSLHAFAYFNFVQFNVIPNMFQHHSVCWFFCAMYAFSITAERVMFICSACLSYHQFVNFSLFTKGNMNMRKCQQHHWNRWSIRNVDLSQHKMCMCSHFVFYALLLVLKRAGEFVRWPLGYCTVCIHTEVHHFANK